MRTRAVSALELAKLYLERLRQIDPALHCVVSYTEELERTAGGIYIPDAAKEKPQRGKIEAVGADVKSVKIGDIVLFDKYSGSKINVEGTDYLIIKEEDILGIFDK